MDYGVDGGGGQRQFAPTAAATLRTDEGRQIRSCMVAAPSSALAGGLLHFPPSLPLTRLPYSQLHARVQGTAGVRRLRRMRALAHRAAGGHGLHAGLRANGAPGGVRGGGCVSGGQGRWGEGLFNARAGMQRHAGKGALAMKYPPHTHTRTKSTSPGAGLGQVCRPDARAAAQGGRPAAPAASQRVAGQVHPPVDRGGATRGHAGGEQCCDPGAAAGGAAAGVGDGGVDHKVRACAVSSGHDATLLVSYFALPAISLLITRPHPTPPHRTT